MSPTTMSSNIIRFNMPFQAKERKKHVIASATAIFHLQFLICNSAMPLWYEINNAYLNYLLYRI